MLVKLKLKECGCGIVDRR